MKGSLVGATPVACLDVLAEGLKQLLASQVVPNIGCMPEIVPLAKESIPL
jgi:hypothetical protein